MSVHMSKFLKHGNKSNIQIWHNFMQFYINLLPNANASEKTFQFVLNIFVEITLIAKKVKMGERRHSVFTIFLFLLACQLSTARFSGGNLTDGMPDKSLPSIQQRINTYDASIRYWETNVS